MKHLGKLHFAISLSLMASIAQAGNSPAKDFCAGNPGFKALIEKGRADGSIPKPESEDPASDEKMDLMESRMMKLGLHSMAYAMVYGVVCGPSRGEDQNNKAVEFMNNTESELKALVEAKNNGIAVDLDKVKEMISNIELVGEAWSLTYNDFSQTRHKIEKFRKAFGLPTPPLE